jgi:carbohydrate kinase (thermoresistant glucokinase family)
MVIHEMVYILMGVSGCGKTMIGRMLAGRMDLPFLDADDFHPAENINKMKQSVPLTDEDREAWLLSLAAKIVELNAAGGAVMACSSLKEKYRSVLSRNGKESVVFIYLKGSRHIIRERMKWRKGHFMPAELLDSQFDILEEPRGALTVSSDGDPEQVCREILAGLENI